MTVTLSVTLHLLVTVVTPLPVITIPLLILVLRVLPLASSVPPLLPALVLPLNLIGRTALVKLFLHEVVLTTHLKMLVLTPPLLIDILSPTVTHETVP
jgi:hypothetical protein